jgi:hypothetical protein
LSLSGGPLGTPEIRASGGAVSRALSKIALGIRYTHFQGVAHLGLAEPTPVRSGKLAGFGHRGRCVHIAVVAEFISNVIGNAARLRRANIATILAGFIHIIHRNADGAITFVPHNWRLLR